MQTYIRPSLVFALGALMAAAAIVGGPTLLAQLQQSGGPGSTVSISNIPHVIVDTAPTTAVTGTFWQATQPVSGTFWQATQPVSIAAAVKTYPSSTCGSTAVGQALVAVPTSSTAVFSSTTCLFTVFFENSNASAQTVTLTDNAGTPLNAMGPGFSVPALSNVILSLGGVPFTSGVKWTAGGTGMLGGMAGFQ